MTDITINGEIVGANESGFSTAINNDGTIIAIGSSDTSTGNVVKILNYTNSEWTEIGNIYGPQNVSFGYSVSLNDVGNVLAIGTRLDNSSLSAGGSVQIYEYTNNSWSPFGDVIPATEAGDQLGQSVELNEYGNVVVAGGQSYGVGVWYYNSGSWVQRGLKISAGGWSGHERSVAINNNGNIIAIGGKNTYIGGSPNHGRVSVYKYDGSAWNGNVLHTGTNSQDQLGFSVSCNKYGNIIAGGAPYGDASDDDGYVKVFAENTAGEWSEIGHVASNLTNNEYLGWSISLDDTGTRLAASGPQYDSTNTTDIGITRIYDYSSGTTWNEIGNVQGSVGGSEGGDFVDLSGDGNSLIIGIKSEGTAKIYSLSSSGGGTGDPYITTISGITYKMEDFSGFSRILQGEYDNKLFILNAETQLLTGDDIDNLVQWKKNNLNGRNLSGTEIQYPAYFKRLYVNWGEDNFIINLDTEEIEEKNYNVNLSYSFELLKEYNWSDKASGGTLIKINIGKLKLLINSYDNKDIRNGFKLNNANLINNRKGAMEHPVYTRDMRLNSITSHKNLIYPSDIKPKKYSNEEFVSDTTKIVKLPVY